MFYFGVDYYPEHWPEERWAEDAQLMTEAGFNVVRLAEFAWARVEPLPGQFDFDWLDRAIDLLADQNMHIVLGTPTASPPPWLMHRYPDLYRVREDGRRVTFGHRREYCPNHAAYHDHSRRITQRMAEHYGQHPAVIGWQIDNEFGDRCYCSHCAASFRDWLRGRHDTLDAVNARWGTIFWSHTYTDWSQIPAPLATAGPPNPGLALDYYRFCSDSYVKFQQHQLEILRSKCPDHFITHNFMGFSYDQIDYFDLACPLDLVVWDNYPRFQWNIHEEPDAVLPALSHDTMRGLKGQPFWVMEQQAGPAGWQIVAPAPRPGQLRLWAYQAIAHGADGIVFFRWRTAYTGSEQYWHGILDHHGQPGRRYDEIRKMGGEIAKLTDHLKGTQPQSRVAIVQSYDSRFAFQIQMQNPDFDYDLHVSEIYRVFHAMHVPVDVVSPEADLSPYALVIAPALHVIDEHIAANLDSFVSKGGVLLVTARSGVKDASNRIVDQPLPGPLSKLCGVEVEEYDSLPPGRLNAVRFVHSGLDSDIQPLARIWCDVLRPLGAEIVAVYEHDYYAGRGAITRHHYGRGHAIYAGTFGHQDLLQPLLSWLLDLADIQPLSAASSDLEIIERCQDNRCLLFIMNHSDVERDFELEAPHRNLIDGTQINGKTRVFPHDLLILETTKDKGP